MSAATGIDEHPDGQWHGKMTRRNALSTMGKLVMERAIVAVGGVSAYYVSQSSTVTSSAPQQVTAGFENFGVTQILPNVIIQQKLDSKHNLQINYKPFTDAPTIGSTFLGSALDVVEDGPMQILANARAKGRPVKVVYPVELATTSVLVRSDSPYNSMLDLKGKRFGVIANPPSTLLLALSLYR